MQRFLISPKARTLSVKKIASMSEKDRLEYFKSIRWNSNKSNPVCPTCGNTPSHYFIEGSLQYRCKDCFYIEAMRVVLDKIIENSVVLDSDFQKIINENITDLLA